MLIIITFDIVKVNVMGKVKVEKTKPMKIAYIEHIGAYGEIPYDEYYSRLYEWAKENKVRPGFSAMNICYDDPEKTPPEQCRSEIAIPIKGTATPDKEIKIKELPSMEVAVIKHKGPSSEYGETYNELSQWIEENGYEWAFEPIPAMEVYTKKPKIVNGETIIYANVKVPVKKK